jgi:hypothetical protein
MLKANQKSLSQNQSTNDNYSENHVNPSSSSQPVSTSIKSSHRTTKKEPVIFFKVYEKPVKNLIEKYLMDTMKNVYIIEFKLTANNNVLVYTNSNDDNIKLVNNTELFNGASRLNLNSIDRKPYILLKNITFDYVKDKVEELRQHGIKEFTK